MKYNIKYYFDGFGEVEIEANSKEEAEEKFSSGDYNLNKEEEWGENYEIAEVEEI